MDDRQQGFTLIELMVVVAIIGILASIAIPQMYAYRQKAFEDTVRSDVRNIATAEEAFYAENQGYIAIPVTTGSAVGNTTYNLTPSIIIKISHNVTVSAMVAPDGSLTIHGSHPGATSPISYESIIGIVH